MEEAKWYVAHTYSGYENKVKVDLEKTIENRNLKDFIFEVRVPVEEVVEVKNGVRKVIERKLFPGYVLVKMIMNQDTWYVVRNTRGVTGFVGAGSEPVPLSDDEMAHMGVGERRNIKVDFEEGDEVVAVSGAWRETVGKIKSINQAKQTVTIMVEMFGRETPVELGFTEVRKK
ncbi:MAG: transcription termination/antitermination factor NusG [Lachnospiraceae bacterium]|nr:transcription termination/antitermination factor NusG [Lachnospiraceae bacterium]